MRVFFGLPIPDDAASKMVPWIAAVGKELPDARLIVPSSLHVTMNFVGEVDDEEVGRLSTICREVAGVAAPIQATLSGLGLLPSPARPRVVYLGIRDGACELQTLAEALRVRVGGGDGQRFLAHVTLGRVRQVSPQSGECFSHCRLPPARGTFRSLVLFQSVLQPGGVAYRPLQKVELGGGM